MSTQQMEEQLWNYIDGTADAKDISYVEGMIASDQAWLAKYHELLEVNNLLKNDIELEQPSMRFTKNVMEQLNGLIPARATKQYINKKIIISIAAFFLLTIAGLIIYGLATMNWNTAPDSTSLLADMKKINSFQFNLSKTTESMLLNVFMMINVVLGLVLVDYYLRKKKSSSQKKQTL